MKNVPPYSVKRGHALAVASLGLCFLLLLDSVRVFAVDGEPNPAALQQISALLVEKESRTPTQRKIDSQLLYGLRQSQGLPPAPGVPNQRLSFTTDGGGQVLVDIRA